MTALLLAELFSPFADEPADFEVDWSEDVFKKDSN